MSTILIAAFFCILTVAAIPVVVFLLGGQLCASALWLIARIVVVGGAVMSISACIFITILITNPTPPVIIGEYAIPLFFAGLGLFGPSVVLVRVAKRAEIATAQ